MPFELQANSLAIGETDQAPLCVLERPCVNRFISDNEDVNELSADAMQLTLPLSDELKQYLPELEVLGCPAHVAVTIQQPKLRSSGDASGRESEFSDEGISIKLGYPDGQEEFTLKLQPANNRGFWVDQTQVVGPFKGELSAPKIKGKDAILKNVKASIDTDRSGSVTVETACFSNRL